MWKQLDDRFIAANVREITELADGDNGRKIIKVTTIVYKDIGTVTNIPLATSVTMVAVE